MIERIYYRVKLNTDQIIYSQHIDVGALEAKLNENIIKDPSKTYLIWKGSQFPNSIDATFKAPVGCVIDWGDGNVETFETASTVVNTHTYTDGIEYHLISLSNYTVFSDEAFFNCSSLTSVTIGNGVTFIGNYVFHACSGLTSVTIPDSVTSIGYSAFRDCSGLTSVTIPDSVTSIGSYAFSGCRGLKSVTIPDNVTSIGSDAFLNCSSLTSVTIGNGVTNIENYVFENCIRLKTIRISAINPPALGSNVFDTSIEKIIVPKSSIDAYKSASGWSTYADKIVYEVDSSDLDAVVTDVVSLTELDSILYPIQRNTQYSTALLTEGNIGKYYTFTTSVLTTSDYWVDPDNITVNAGTVVKILPIEDSHGAGIKPFFKIVGIDNRELYLTNGQGKCSIVKRAYGNDTTPKAIGYYSNVFSVDTDSQFGGQATSKYSTLFGVNVRADNNAEGSIVGGRYCIVDSPYTFAYGRGITTQANQETTTKVVLGHSNKFNTKAILEIGNGTDILKSNAFEVLKDGRAKVQSAPAENDDVLRLNELSVLTQEQVNSLF